MTAGRMELLEDGPGGGGGGGGGLARIYYAGRMEHLADGPGSIQKQTDCTITRLLRERADASRPAAG